MIVYIYIKDESITVHVTVESFLSISVGSQNFPDSLGHYFVGSVIGIISINIKQI